MDDAIDGILEQWRRERPDLDLSALGVFGRIMQLSAGLTAFMERWCAAHGMRAGEFDVLTALRRAGPAMPSDLADALMMSRSGMTKRLDGLEATGLVERTLDPADRRSFVVALTERGRELIDEALTEHAANMQRMAAVLSVRERAAMEKSLRALLAADDAG
ncbi:MULTISPECIES: MarR family winged helix-turn-helix transcriptional regulator [unclassified Kutzneria]|uniref:MarR family winged helix-turn-helix transcriptional regulator n=1 Tax=unclassified Kutzneria TaxID=2621979 RepID=UPI0003EEC73F|nr:MarR family transcriptional regulator [Kutzneria sp. 744]EWM16992.1 transcriptional regulator PecS [Kutzneria sp. 744]